MMQPGYRIKNSADETTVSITEIRIFRNISQHGESENISPELFRHEIPQKTHENNRQEEDNLPRDSKNKDNKSSGVRK